MFAQEPPPDFDVPGRRESGERPELVAEVGLVEVAGATGKAAPVDRFGVVDREHGGHEAVGAVRPPWPAGLAAQQWRTGPKPALPSPAGHTARPRASAGTAPAPTP